MRREQRMNPKCLGRAFPDTFSRRSAHLTGLKMRRITRAVSFNHLVGAGEQARRHRRERAWPVVSLALEKRLFLSVRRKRLLVSPFGKKLCDINERLNPF